VGHRTGCNRDGFNGVYASLLTRQAGGRNPAGRLKQSHRRLVLELVLVLVLGRFGKTREVIGLSTRARSEEQTVFEL
jgi:hypothetical protein